MFDNESSSSLSTTRKVDLNSPDAAVDPFARELRAESITVRIRWFGLAVGYLLVNVGPVMGSDNNQSNQFALNAILTVGAFYAIIDAFRSWSGRVLLAEFRILISLLEALFIGLLCYFDTGITSPFRFYYFLSLLVCAIRHSRQLSTATLGLHATSYCLLAMFSQQLSQEDTVLILLTLVFLGWAAWAIISLTGLLKSAGGRLTELNSQLKDNQLLLEERIQHRTRELQESQALLVQQEKQAAFGLLAAGIAHEVGNPLASISSIVQMLTRRVTDDYTKERLGLVDGQLSRIHRTLQELVGFSRPANQQATLVDVHAAINNSLNIAKYYKRWKGKTVKTDFADGTKAIRTIYDQLVQVVLNLVLNALDATEEGAGITVRTSKQTVAGEDKIAIDIADEGHGIPAESQAKIFEPYYTTKSSGTGLGLFVCRQLAEHELNGSIELRRSDTTGTEFRILIGEVTAGSDN